MFTLWGTGPGPGPGPGPYPGPSSGSGQLLALPSSNHRLPPELFRLSLNNVSR